MGPKPPLKLKEIWAIRIRLQVAQRLPDLALFNLALDSKLRGCDLVRLRVGDLTLSGQVRSRATAVQQKTGRPVQFEITDQTRDALAGSRPRRCAVATRCSPAALIEPGR